MCASIDARAWSSRGTCSARLPDFGRRYARHALAQGLLLRPIGHTLYAMPPYVIDEAEGELLARMRAVVRRRSGVAQSIVGNGVVQLDLATREVLRGGAREALTAREFALLQALLERPGAILSREQLENRIYGWGEEVSSNAVDVLIHGMRRKLGPDAIRNVRGLGWRVAAP
mgnify:CR=1 FL=1